MNASFYQQLLFKFNLNIVDKCKRPLEQCYHGNCISSYEEDILYTCSCYEYCYGKDCLTCSCAKGSNYECQNGKCINESCICDFGYNGPTCKTGSYI